MKKPTKAEQEVIRDEQQATTREAARWAAIEKERAIDAADRAATAASYESSGLKARLTFRGLFMKFWRGEQGF